MPFHFKPNPNCASNRIPREAVTIPITPEIASVTTDDELIHCNSPESYWLWMEELREAKDD